MTAPRQRSKEGPVHVPTPGSQAALLSLRAEVATVMEQTLPPRPEVATVSNCGASAAQALGAVAAPNFGRQQADAALAEPELQTQCQTAPEVRRMPTAGCAGCKFQLPPPGHAPECPLGAPPSRPVSSVQFAPAPAADVGTPTVTSIATAAAVARATCVDAVPCKAMTADVSFAKLASQEGAFSWVPPDARRASCVSLDKMSDSTTMLSDALLGGAAALRGEVAMISAVRAEVEEVALRADEAIAATTPAATQAQEAGTSTTVSQALADHPMVAQARADHLEKIKMRCDQLMQKAHRNVSPSPARPVSPAPVELPPSLHLPVSFGPPALAELPASPEKVSSPTRKRTSLGGA